MVKFNDGKDHNAFRTIGEVSDALGIKPHVLRYWEQQFSLLKPLKRSGGRRHYRPKDVEMVATINRLVNEEGYTLKGAEAVLRSGGVKPQQPNAKDQPVAAAADVPLGGKSSDTAETVSKLKNIRGRLARAVEA